MRYTGRFAPSPTGPLHAGSLVAALASWLDARAQGGRWLVRIEDVDGPRCVRGADGVILAQLAACGLVSDDPPVRQSTRDDAYTAALERLVAAGQAYACACSRKEVGDGPYPGTCRAGLRGRAARAMRLLTLADDGGEVAVDWNDRRLHAQRQNVTREVGDFVLKRADGLWAYQLAVVVDDAEQGITHVVRGEDLADNTPRQVYLQQCLDVPTPVYLHVPLVRGADGQKLSKQNGARPLDLVGPPTVMKALATAARTLELPALRATTTADWLAQAVHAWGARWVA